MKVLSYTKYVYLFVAALSIYKIVETYNSLGTIDYLFVVFAVVSLFMFFFRRHYEQKFKDRKNQK
ncbi:hypothetical protein [Kordia zhangzhouensis]|uniref:hypothetical protein n=1 Tax=Kordia zhangzhouensis TaxID=1620405 RepID=UPI000629C6F3|nr:hypothetical protein [Kordia zhangzhouensis]